MPEDKSPPETIKLIAELIEGELESQPGIVQIYNQKRRLPPTKGLFVDVAILGDKPYGYSQHMEVDPTSEDLVEVGVINMLEVIQVMMFSYDDSARTRRHAIIHALQTVAAQQLQEKYSFKIATLPSSFVDVSEVNASARLNSYAATFNVLRAYERRMLVPTFTHFTIPPANLLINQ